MKKTTPVVKRNLPKTDIRKEAMIQALEKTLGVATPACKKVGITSETHYQWMKTDEIYNDRVLKIKEISIDFVESKMFKLINDGDSGLVKYYLSTQGKKRGYIEKQLVEHSGDSENPVKIIVSRPK